MSRTSTSSVLVPVRSASNLVEQVVDQLREQIVGGQLNTGDTLPPEGQLAEVFGVSRTVVREAMHQLKFAGLVKVTHGRRPRVAAPSATVTQDSFVTWIRRSDVGIQQLLEVRRPIECEIVRLVIDRIDLKQVESLRDPVKAMRRATSMRDRIDADQAYHIGLARATGNPVFEMMLDAMADLLEEQRRRTLRGKGATLAADDHEAMLDSILARDVDAAIEVMIDHMVWPK